MKNKIISKSYTVELDNPNSMFNTTLCLARDMQDNDKELIESKDGFIKWLEDDKE